MLSLTSTQKLLRNSERRNFKFGTGSNKTVSLLLCAHKTSILLLMLFFFFEMFIFFGFDARSEKRKELVGKISEIVSFPILSTRCSSYVRLQQQQQQRFSISDVYLHKLVKRRLVSRRRLI